MLDKLTQGMRMTGDALVLRAERQRVLASNIANVDTPGYVARDFNFSEALADASSEGGIGRSLGNLKTTNSRHLDLIGGGSGSLLGGKRMGYAVASQPSADGNSVDLDRERGAFADNALRYEAALRFINGDVKDILSAIQGQ